MTYQELKHPNVVELKHASIPFSSKSCWQSMGLWWLRLRSEIRCLHTLRAMKTPARQQGLLHLRWQAGRDLPQCTFERLRPLSIHHLSVRTSFEFVHGHSGNIALYIIIYIIAKPALPLPQVVMEYCSDTVYRATWQLLPMTAMTRGIWENASDAQLITFPLRLWSTTPKWNSRQAAPVKTWTIKVHENVANAWECMRMHENGLSIDCLRSRLLSLMEMLLIWLFTIVNRMLVTISLIIHSPVPLWLKNRRPSKLMGK